MKELTKVRTWYMEIYPSDELGEEINPYITFMDVFEALDNYKDIYEVIQVHDSVIRERIFEKLSEITGHTYEEVYNQWLRA